MVSIFFAVLSSQQMTIGKIYCAKLIYENYKHMKKKRLEKKKKVSAQIALLPNNHKL